MTFKPFTPQARGGNSSDSFDPETIKEDIAKAIRDEKTKREKILLDADERLQSLDELRQQFESKQIDIQQVSLRLRTIIRGEKITMGPTKAGRHQIGASPMGETPSGITSREGPTPGVAQTTLSKTLALVEQRMVLVMAKAREPQEKEQARFEMAYLLYLKRTIEEQLIDPPRDVILNTSLIEYTQEVITGLTELEGPPETRLRRLNHFNRILLGQIVAMGSKLSGMKEQIRKIQNVLTKNQGDSHPLLNEVYTLQRRLLKEVEKIQTPTKLSLLEEISRVSG